MVLLSLFFSPGTGSMVATTLWVPLGGAASSLTVQVAFLPANVSGTVAVPPTLVPLIDTLHLTLRSLLVPPLLKSSVNDGIGLDGRVFVAPVCRVVPLTLTEVSEWPCRPGATLVGCAPGMLMPSVEARKLGWTH